MTFLVLAVVLVPLLASLTIWLPGRAGRTVLAASQLAALPAIALAALAREPLTVDLPWLFLGAGWGVDGLGRAFLAFTGMLWLAGSFFAWGYHAGDPHRQRFHCLFLLAMAGNLGLILAFDAPSFLAGFAVMSFASYGLIVHQARPADLHAGRVYLALVVTGEVLLVSAVACLVAAGADSDLASMRTALAALNQPGVYCLLIAGFGIKLGLLPLHFWLPLAHPAAPTAASALLSGAMIKAGLLGLLRLLPAGQVAVPWIGEPLLVLGLTAALGAAVVGMTQPHPKIVLAYSSISQMGLVTVALGAAMMAPAAADGLIVAIVLLAAHHALAKAALFLGVGVADCTWQTPRQTRAVGLLLAIPALALAGLPLTSGYLAKTALKGALEVAWVLPFLTATGVTTTLLVARYLVVVWPKPGAGHRPPAVGLWLPPLVLVALGLTLPWIATGAGWIEPAKLAISPGKLLYGSWPILLGGGIAVWLWRRPIWKTPWHVPAGDLSIWVVAVVRGLVFVWRRTIERVAAVLDAGSRHLARVLGSKTTGSLSRLAPHVESWDNVGLAVIGLILAVAVLLG